MRDGVQLVDGAAGHYADVLLCPPADCALVVFEARRYSRHAQLLCRKAREAGIEVTLVTDTFCDWADQSANEVCKQLGPDVEKRLEATAALHNEFVGYTSSPGSKQ